MKCFEKKILWEILLSSQLALQISSCDTPPPPPIGVLDAAACGSQQIEGTSAGAPTISSENSPASKRRKNR
jgi:hypothetical protein